MSSRAVGDELERFLHSNNAGVFVIKGKWGVGKTYLVKEVVERSRAGWKGRKYAYVSLFGINSLDELQERIFVEAEAANSTQRVEAPSFIDRNRYFRWLYQPISKMRPNIKQGVKQISETTSGIGSLQAEILSRSTQLLTKFWIARAIPGSKICIDDIERRGDNLPMRDLLGFLSQLKEQRGCQIILILNQDELGESQSQFDLYREKVVDKEVAFIPNTSEIIQIGGFPIDETLPAEILQELEADNIRVVQKTKRFLDELYPLLEGLDDDARSEVFQSAVIIGWFYFARDKDNTSWDYVRTFDSMAGLLGPHYDGQTTEPQQSEATKDIRNKLRRLNFWKIGHLEELLIDTLKRGFADTNKFDEILPLVSEKAKMAQARRQVSKAWDIFRNSFDDNQKCFVDAIVTCFKEQSVYYDFHGLEEAMGILTRLGKEKEAYEILEHFFANRDTAKFQRDPESLTFIGDKRIHARVAQETRKKAESLDVIQVLDKSTRYSGWDEGDIDVLNSYSEDDWFFLFKKRLRGDERLRPYVKRAVDFGKVSLPDPRYKQIGHKVKAALTRIGRESEINRERVAALGVEFDGEKQQP